MLRFPASSCVLSFEIVMYPKRSSFTLVGERTRVLESCTAWNLWRA